MIRRAWVWYEDGYTNSSFVETLMELESGELIALTIGGYLVGHGQNYINSDVPYDLIALRQDAERHNDAWTRVL